MLFPPHRYKSNVPWHIRAPAVVACDIIIVRRSAHPAGGFCIIGNEISYYTKNRRPCSSVVCKNSDLIVRDQGFEPWTP